MRAIYSRLPKRRSISLAILGVIALGLAVTSKAQTSSLAGKIDGSKHPELIPDEEMHALLFLTATAASSGARDVDRQRAQAFIHGLPLSPADQAIFAEQAQAYRNGREELARLAGSTVSSSVELAQQTTSNLYKRLSGLGSSQMHFPTGTQ